MEREECEYVAVGLLICVCVKRSRVAILLPQSSFLFPKLQYLDDKLYLYTFGRYPLAAVMSAENKGDDDDDDDATHGPVEQDGIIASSSQPNNHVASNATNGHEQEDWLEDDGHCHIIRSNRTRTIINGGGYAPTSGLDQVDDAGLDPTTTSVNSDSNAAEYTTVTSSFQRIALTFSTQGLGFVSVPLLAYPLLELGCNADVLWRVLLGVGALPGVVVLYLRLFSNKVRDCKSSNESIDADALEGDKLRRIDDDDQEVPADSTNNTVPKIQEETQPPRNTKNDIGHNIMASTLFSDVSGLEQNNSAILDEKYSELALVDHSYTSSDNVEFEKRIESRDDASDDPPMTPRRNHTPGL